MARIYSYLFDIQIIFLKSLDIPNGPIVTRTPHPWIQESGISSNRKAVSWTESGSDRSLKTNHRRRSGNANKESSRMSGIRYHRLFSDHCTQHRAGETGNPAARPFGSRDQHQA